MNAQPPVFRDRCALRVLSFTVGPAAAPPRLTPRPRLRLSSRPSCVLPRACVSHTTIKSHTHTTGAFCWLRFCYFSRGVRRATQLPRRFVWGYLQRQEKWTYGPSRLGGWIYYKQGVDKKNAAIGTEAFEDQDAVTKATVYRVWLTSFYGRQKALFFSMLPCASNCGANWGKVATRSYDSCSLLFFVFFVFFAVFRWALIVAQKSVVAKGLARKSQCFSLISTRARGRGGGKPCRSCGGQSGRETVS